MAARRGVGTARAVGRRTAPDALVASGAVPVQPVRAVHASMPIAGRAAPFAVLLVIAVFVKPVRAVHASVPVARRAAMSAFCRHVSLPFAGYYTKSQLLAPVGIYTALTQHMGAPGDSPQRHMGRGTWGQSPKKTTPQTPSK